MDRDGLWQVFQADTQRITALDQMATAIRGWTITLASGLAAFGLSEGSRRMVLSALAVPVLFGILDVRYRATQLLHAARVDALQTALVPDHPLRPDPGQARRSGRWRYASAVAFHAALAVVLLIVALAM